MADGGGGEGGSGWRVADRPPQGLRGGSRGVLEGADGGLVGQVRRARTRGEERRETTLASLFFFLG